MNRLKELRTEKGVSQQVIADYLGITRQSYSNYELGTREADYETLVKMAKYFDVTVDYLIGNSDSKSAAGSAPIDDDDIKFALFDGDQGISDEAYEEVKRFAAFIKEKYKKD